MCVMTLFAVVSVLTVVSEDVVVLWLVDRSPVSFLFSVLLSPDLGDSKSHWMFLSTLMFVL